MRYLTIQTVITIIVLVPFVKSLKNWTECGPCHDITKRFVIGLDPDDPNPDMNLILLPE